MAYDVASSINELLFKNESVIIPGFGGFELNEHSANIDYIKSTITPPSKVPSFNKNLTLNDGVLIDFIKKQNRCTLEQANHIVKDFVKAAEKKIEAKEILEFPKVGRLYKDYSKSLQFLPYDTNFNTNAFGLPVIEVHPFSRNNNTKAAAAAAAATVATKTINERESIANATSASTATATANVVKENPIAANEVLTDEEKVATIPLGEPKSKGVFYWIQKTLPLLIIASLCIIGLSFFLMRKGGDTKTSNTTASLTADGDDKKINTAPSIEEAEITPITDSEDDMYDSENGGGTTDTGDAAEEATDSYDSSSLISGRECIVIVGQFSDKVNARRFIEQIESDGYDSYMGWNSDKGWNTVGVKFSYGDENEKNRIHRKLKNEYDNAAWIYRD